MAQNGMGEIKAAEARLALAKKAKARSTECLRNARRILQAATDAAKKAHDEDNEAAEDLKAAEAALEAINSKWELIEIDCDGGEKRDAPLTVDVTNAKSVNVHGCGMADVNGPYAPVNDEWNGAPYFRHEKYSDIFLRSDQDFYWCISQGGYVLYKCKSIGSSSLNEVWTVCCYGVNPPPKLEIKLKHKESSTDLDGNGPSKKSRIGTKIEKRYVLKRMLS